MWQGYCKIERYNIDTFTRFVSINVSCARSYNTNSIYFPCFYSFDDDDYGDDDNDNDNKDKVI